MSGKILKNSFNDISFTSQYDNNHDLTSDHAIVLAAIANTTCLDYVKSVASVIGSSHIHSVFKDGPLIKIYMKEKKYVQTVINHGVFVKGCQMNVDFFEPPGTKVILSNVDPIVPDKCLLCLLSCYGSFESSLIHQKISDEEGYTHIENSSRVIYMKIAEDKTIPSKLPLVHGNVLYEIYVQVEGPAKMFRLSGSQTE